MKKIFLLSILFVLMATAKSQQIAKWKITDVERYISQHPNEILVINFWATFCKPCVAEIPSFIKITDQYKNDKVKLLLVSLDLPSYYPKKIADFAKKQQFNTSIVWLQETDADYFCPKVDSSWSGSIPATLIVNTKTGYRKFFEEEIAPEEFEKYLQKAMDGQVKAE